MDTAAAAAMMCSEFCFLHSPCRFTLLACYVDCDDGGDGGGGGDGGLKSVYHLMKDSCNRSQFICNLPALKYVSPPQACTLIHLQMRTNFYWQSKLELVTNNQHTANGAPFLFFHCPIYRSIFRCSPIFHLLLFYAFIYHLNCLYAEPATMQCRFSLRCIGSRFFSLLISTANNRVRNYTNANLMWKRLRVCDAVLAEHYFIAGNTIVGLRLSSWLWCERLCDALRFEWKQRGKFKSMDSLRMNENPFPKSTRKHFIETAIHPCMHHSIWRKRCLFDVCFRRCDRSVLWRSVRTSFSTLLLPWPPPSLLLL